MRIASLLRRVWLAWVRLWLELRDAAAECWREPKALRIPSALLIALVVSHFGYGPIASFYPEASQLSAARAWKYVLGAAETAVLYLSVWVLYPWKPVAARYAASLVCVWGIAEALMIAGCRLQYPMDQPPPDTKLYTGLCDLVTGWPVYMLTLLLVLLVAALRRHNARRRNDAP